MKNTAPPFPANCQTTAMGIMPHTDIERALQLCLGMDIPFWPQLPNVSFYEDMYVQASEHFPGMRVNPDLGILTFNTALFREEVAGDYTSNLENPDIFSLSRKYSAVYHRFLELDLSSHAAIRGQIIGPVSFGFRVNDQDRRPIIYDDEVRTILFDFILRKANAQYRELRERNPNAFVWLDEPGLGWLFSGMSGYGDIQARADYETLLAQIEGPRGLHLCASINLPYLLELGVDVLSFDAYQLEGMPRAYAEAAGAFMLKGGIICWGIVPTEPEGQGKEVPESLTGKITRYWGTIAEATGLPPEQIARQSLVAPARCMLKNTGRVGAAGESGNQPSTGGRSSDLSIEEELVETGFRYTIQVSRMLKERYL